MLKILKKDDKIKDEDKEMSLTKLQVFLVGVIVTITVFWPGLVPAYYVPLVISFGLYSLLIFPIIAGIVSAIIIRLFRGATMTLDAIIDRINLESIKDWLVEFLKKGKVANLTARVFLYLTNKVNIKRLKNTLVKLFKKGRWIALIGSAFLLCPIIVPIVAKTCIKNEKNYILSLSF